jgi:uncharacterized protein YpmS
MTNWRRRIVLLVVVVIGAIVIAGTVLYLMVKHVPAFYDKALAINRQQLEESREELLERVEQLKQDVRFTPAFHVTLTDDQLNGWLANNYDSGSRAISRPRLAIHPGFVEIGCRARYKSWESVISARLTLRPSDRRNVVEVQIRSIKAGSLSVGWDGVLDQVRQAVERTRLQTSWKSGDGEATVEVVIPARWTQVHRSVVIESIELDEGQVTLRGRTE